MAILKYRLFIYLPILINSLLTLFNYDKAESELKVDFIMSKITYNKGNFDDLIEEYIFFFIYFFAISELICSILAVLGCNLFGKINALLVLIHGFLQLRPISKGIIHKDVIFFITLVCSMLICSYPQIALNMNKAKLEKKENKTEANPATASSHVEK